MSVRQIILVGRHLSIAEAVASRLGPEFKVAGIMLSLEDLSSKTPSLFQSTCPSPPPIAIAFGGGFDDDAFSQARSIATRDSWPRINWLRPDSSKQGRISGGGKFDIEKDGERYGEEVGERIRRALLKLEGEGKLGEKAGEEETTLF